MPLRAYLSMLAVATLLPVALFAAILGYFLVEQDRETFRRGAEERALAMITAIDTAISGDIATLEALATTPSLETGDLANFRDRAERVIATRPDWATINLAIPTGQQVMNLRRPPGAPLPVTTVFDPDFRDVVERRRPFISNLVSGPLVGGWTYSVRIPVVREGSVRYLLSAVVRPQAISRLVQRQGLPAEWVGVVLDRHNRIVARTVDQEKTVGQPASQSLRDALDRSASGWFRGSTIEGAAVYTPYRRSEISGWVFAMGIPATVVDRVAWRAAILFAAGLLAALALAVALAHVVGRRISDPIAALASATGAIGRGETIEVPQNAAIAEVQVLARTLRGSIDTIRERSERMRMALDAGRMGSWELDVRTNEVKWSPELEAIHGLRPGGFGGTFATFEKDIYPEDRDKVQRAVAESLRTGVAEHHMEYRIVRPDGAVRWVEGRGKVFRDDSGAPLRLVGVCTDVTDRKRAEEALRQADRAKDEFLAMLSHELRNPLAALSAASHVLRRSPAGSPTALKANAVIDRQTSHMARLVEDLLDISRVTMGKLTLERQALDLGAAVSAQVHAWRIAGRLEGRARVAVEAAPVWISADPARVEQIIANLLDNALKYTPAEGSIRMSVARKGTEAVLTVTDSGRGIAPEMVPRVFDPFVQGAQHVARPEGGLGLGLALVKRLAEAHGGRAGVESEGVGRGATFTVRLPAGQAPAERAAAAARVTRVAGPRRILLIEDNTDAREMLRAALALKGHEVREAPSGKAGLEAAAEMRPDVALIDIGLPDMDGYEVARRLRASSNGTPLGLIAITGYGQPEDQRRAYDAGFDLHLTKPVAAEELEQLMARLQ